MNKAAIIISIFVASLFSFTALPTLAATLRLVETSCTDEMFKGKSRYSENLSGISCKKTDGNSWDCYVIADERVGLQRFALNRLSDGSYSCRPGKIIARNKGFSCLKGKKAERDFEAMARDGDYLYISGSWGNRRKSNVGAAPERWVFVRQPLRASGKPSSQCTSLKRRILRDFVKYHAGVIAQFIDTPLQCGGLNIEGLAVMAGKAYFGLRSPFDVKTGKSYVLETSLEGLFDGTYSTRLHSLDLGTNGVGVRAMQSLGNGQILIVSGDGGVGWNKLSPASRTRVEARCAVPTAPLYQNRAKHNQPALWLWSPDNGGVKSLGVVPGNYDRVKLEGIALLNEKPNRLTLLAVYDDVEYHPFVVIEVKY